MEPRRRHSAAPRAASPEVHAVDGAAGAAFLETKDCASYPAFCAAPFDCHKTNRLELHGWARNGWASEGRPNWKTWCLDSRYAPYAGRCAAGDLAGAALLQFQRTTAGEYGEHTMELDASACFMDGHCANAAVTSSTTVEEAVRMCDERFGRKAWSTFGSESSPPENRMGFALDGLTDYSNGFASVNQTRPYMLAACAMGNYHCDVMYCRHYCGDERYVRKYGHLLEKHGWVQ